jgi:hypothetical protein
MLKVPFPVSTRNGRRGEMLTEHEGAAIKRNAAQGWMKFHR